MQVPKKKRHHYIPRFYLKKFSNNKEGKQLGLFNHVSKKFVRAAPLASQAYKNFLYGKDDEVENEIAKMEETISELFHYWTEEKILILPPKDSDAFKLLKRFILFQGYRTPKSGDKFMATINKGLKVLLKEFQPELIEELKGSRLVHDNPVLLMLLNSIEHEHLLNHLDSSFIVNLSPLPFITSDSPVVFYNQLMEQAGNHLGSTGLAAKGLQIFYPIHPRLMICLYDANIYNFGNSRENVCSTESTEEIHQLNGLQLTNSKSQVFFDDSITEDYISELYKNFFEYRETAKDINKIIHKGNRKFFFTGYQDAYIKLSLNFFSLRVKAESFKGGLVPIRHPSLK